MTPQPDVPAFGSTPTWLPAGEFSVLRAAGTYFDVVRCRGEAGRRAMALLGQACGPVITSQNADFVDVLFPLEVLPERLEAASAWKLAPGTGIRVPPLRHTEGPGLRWAVPPGRGITSPDQLLAVLRPAAPLPDPLAIAPPARSGKRRAAGVRLAR
ncbi:hypothetical protein [Kitasatospora aureofaciens]|uniref:hypothetical protein n=1 Tax=Kitasatospora aureofaciens TaxID=1894 RepID=UPI000524DACA|nr:hypothetical protein [Kitasatospora aureofaciens]